MIERLPKHTKGAPVGAPFVILDISPAESLGAARTIHVKDDGLGASVLAMVDGVDHLYDGLTLMYYFLLAVKTDDGQFALHEYAVVHHRMMVPAQLLPGRELVFHGNQFGTALQVVGQLHAIPTLRSANQLGGLHRHEEAVVLRVTLIFATRDVRKM